MPSGVVRGAVVPSGVVRGAVVRGGVVRAGRERGMVTAELAFALPVLVFVLGTALSAVSLGIDQVRCVDGARAGARLLARGESVSLAVAAAGRAAPAGARVALESVGGQVRVTVGSDPPPLLAALGLAAGPSAQSTADLESALGGP